MTRKEIEEYKNEYVSIHSEIDEKVITDFTEYLKSKIKTKAADDTEEIKTIIEYFNSVTNSRYTTRNQSNVRHIKARLNEGYTFHDFKIVIDKMYRKWSKDSKMAQYLRPETLFGTKFEGYLNMKDVTENKQQEYIDRWVNV